MEKTEYPRNDKSVRNRPIRNEESRNETYKTRRRVRKSSDIVAVKKTRGQKDDTVI